MNFLKTFLAAILAFIVGSVLFFVIAVFIVIGMATSLSKQHAVVVKPESILKIDLAEQLTDAPSNDPFAGIDFATMSSVPQLSLMQALNAIEAAKTDDRIKGIYLRMNGSGGTADAGVVEELRDALADFKQSGKFIVSYNEIYSQGQYFLASVADKIYMQPQGSVEWSGLSADMMFFKGLLDKLDVKVELFRPDACIYKSAAEMYVLDKMSPASRLQTQRMVDSAWGIICSEVSAARGIDSLALNRMADNLEMAVPEDAVKLGLVDSLTFEDGMNDVFAARGVQADADNKYNFVSLRDYAGQLVPDTETLSADRIAVVYAEGEIYDGEGGSKGIYGNTLAATLRRVREDDKVKAVVLRVNSPGGSGLAADVIRREVELLKEQKPVIVSMGGYAASGGYYISTPADVIVADKMTLTGSIGVFGTFLYTNDALKNKLGITMDGVRTNTSAGMGVKGDLTANERAALMRGVNAFYDTFTGYVAQGRNLPIEQVRDIAKGRVWTGDDALGIGLIDTYGGIKTAIALAADKADLGDNFRVVEVLDRPTGLAAFFSAISSDVSSSMMRSQIGEAADELHGIEQALSRKGIMMYAPERIDLK